MLQGDDLIEKFVFELSDDLLCGKKIKEEMLEKPMFKMLP